MPTPTQAQEQRQQYGHPDWYFLLATPAHVAPLLPTAAPKAKRGARAKG